MDQLVDQGSETVDRTIEHEMQMVREAIALVASGASRRVIVAGLRLGHQLLDPGRRVAIQAGVRLVPLWDANGAGVDIAIEREIDEPT